MLPYVGCKYLGVIRKKYLRKNKKFILGNAAVLEVGI